jgi:hypothetical protein
VRVRKTDSALVREWLLSVRVESAYLFEPGDNTVIVKKVTAGKLPGIVAHLEGVTADGTCYGQME